YVSRGTLILILTLHNLLRLYYVSRGTLFIILTLYILLRLYYVSRETLFLIRLLYNHSFNNKIILFHIDLTK
ncbi:MAG: hypothetical protein ACI312_03885, partial [Bacilli bacterium]